MIKAGAKQTAGTVAIAKSRSTMLPRRKVTLDYSVQASESVMVDLGR